MYFRYSLHPESFKKKKKKDELWRKYFNVWKAWIFVASCSHCLYVFIYRTFTVSLSFCVTVLSEIIQSGRLADPSLYHSHDNVDDITASTGGGANHQPSSCDFDSWSAPVSPPWPHDPNSLSFSFLGCSRGAVRHHPVSSSGMKGQVKEVVQGCETCSV